MFAKKDEGHHDRGIKAFLEYGCEFEGKLTFNGIVRVNGKIKGDIHSESCLIVGETAEIEGTLNVGSLIVGGRITGDVVAKERVEIQSTGNIKGRIHSAVLVTQEGGQLEGDVRIVRTEKTIPHNKSA